MSGQQDNIAAFSANLREFASNTSDNINGLKRIANSIPCVGPSVFREKWKDVVKRVDNVQGQVAAMEKACGKETAVQALLSQYVALHHEHQTRLSQLLGQLQQYGYQAEYKGPVAVEPLQLLALTDMQQVFVQTGLSRTGLGRAVSGAGASEPETQEVTPSPEPLGDLMTRYGQEQKGQKVQFEGSGTGRASQRLSTASVSDLDMTPSMRELQRKYASDSSGVASVKRQPRCGAGASDSGLFSRYCSEGLASETPGAVGKQLAYLSLETPSGALKSAAEGGDLGKAMDHLALEHPRFSPTNRSSDDLDREGAMSAAALPLASVGAPGPPAWPPAGEGTLPGMRSRSKQESMNARLAAGEHPWDMISLKAAIQAAQPGSGEIPRMIAHAAFQPQAAAFTSMLSMCAKNREWQKALEVFQAMRDYHPAVRPNTVHYSSLISACATVGRCEEAMQVFLHMQSAARTDKGCMPNVITYSALITAFVAGGRLDKAYEVFMSMRSSNVHPDHICYSTLIAGFERSGDMEMARQIAHKMRIDGKHIPPATSPTHGPRLSVPRTGSYGDNSHAFGPHSPPRGLPYVLDSANASPIRGLGLAPHTAKMGHVRFTAPYTENSYSLPAVPQSPRDITGEFNGRDQLIPAVYGTASLADQIQALPDEDALNGILGARTPSLFAATSTLTAASGMSFLDNMTGNVTGTTAYTPACAISGQMGTPSTADLLRAAQSGSTAQLHMEANQFGTATAPFAPESLYGSPPRKQQQPFSLFGGETARSSASADPELPLHAAPGSPGGNRLSTLQNRTFDTAPGSPLRRGASSITVGPISRQGTPQKSMLDKTHSVLQSLMEGASSDGERSLGNPDGLPASLASTLSRGSSTSVDPQTSSISRQPSVPAGTAPCDTSGPGNLPSSLGTSSSSQRFLNFAGGNAQGRQQQSADAYAPSGVHPPLPQEPRSSYLWAAGSRLGAHSSENLSPGGSPNKASKLNVNAPAWTGSPSKPTATSSAAPAPTVSGRACSAIPPVSSEEFKKMPLRLSRQLLLDQWNEAIAFVSSTLDARLATCDAHAGLAEDDLEPLQLSKEQRSALLIMLHQSGRMCLVMRGSKHTYVLPKPHLRFLKSALFQPSSATTPGQQAARIGLPTEMKAPKMQVKAD